ncbi:hypothetical protein [Halomonas ramblicola]|uniref:hypothetical protein n=1 Tax=Halomonas ramblicola TaxID=747349 RepID=UPI0025B56491|nr:hypothetical protein [Halomonas ramblicola]MDN3522556.1 hypothetical protein [Halomonas ramblicola]
MSLDYGDITASSGMSQAIYLQMDALLSPPLQQAVDEAEKEEVRAAAQEALDKAREGWRKLSYAIARGVVEHLIGHLEIDGVRTRGTVNIRVTGDTEPADGHRHGVDLGDGDTATFDQINGGTGLVS